MWGRWSIWIGLAFFRGNLRAANAHHVGDALAGALERNSLLLGPLGHLEVSRLFGDLCALRTHFTNSVRIASITAL